MQHSLTFDTTVDSGDDVALAVAYAYGYESVEDLLTEGLVEIDEEDDVPPATASAPNGWTKPKMVRYVGALKPAARKILKVIAQEAPEVTIEHVQQAADLEAYKYAGSMSSFGFAANNTRGVKERPFNKVGKSYQMDPKIARLALDALLEYSS